PPGQPGRGAPGPAPEPGTGRVSGEEKQRPASRSQSPKIAKLVADTCRMVQDDRSPARDLTCSRLILGTILGKTNGQSTDEDCQRDDAQPARKAADRARDTSQERRDDRQ